MPAKRNGRPFIDPIAVNRLREAVNNEVTSRSALVDRFFSHLTDDLYKACRYPTTGELTPEYYRELFDRDPLANRAVRIIPEECWQKSPSVYEDEDTDSITPFEEAWDALGQNLRGEACWYQDEAGSPIFEYLKRADTRSRIGRFGILLLGFDDGKNLQDPVEGTQYVVNRKIMPIHDKNGKIRGMTVNWQRDGRKRLHDCWLTPEEESHLRALPNLTANESAVIDSWARERETTVNRDDSIQGTDRQYQAFGLGMADPVYPSASGTDQQYFGVQFGPSEQPSDKPSKKKRQLLFMRAYDESLVQIVRYEWNIRNPRFGLPVMYRVTLNDPREQHSGIGLPMATVFVHWSRVIHLAANRGNSEVFGVPEMQPVVNPILDARKVRGASAEGYWKSCFTGLSLETHPQLGGDVLINRPQVKGMVHDYFEGLDRGLVTTGMAVKTLAPSVVDPSPHEAVHIEAICIQKGCPVRVFKGSERGELASGQDDEAWNERKTENNNNYTTPRVIVPFIDRCIQTGVLPEPEGYSIEWPDLDSLGDKDRAAIQLTRVQAYAAYVSSGVDSLIAPQDYLTREAGYTEEEAQEIMKNTISAQEDEMQQHQEMADEQGFKPAPPPGFQKPEPETPPQAPTPIKMGAGETLVHPETGKTLAKTKPTANEEVMVLEDDN